MLLPRLNDPDELSFVQMYVVLYETEITWWFYEEKKNSAAAEIKANKQTTRMEQKKKKKTSTTANAICKGKKSRIKK